MKLDDLKDVLKYFESVKHCSFEFIELNAMTNQDFEILEIISKKAKIVDLLIIEG